MKLSVVTTTYNRPRHFRLFLAALAGQTRRPDEVVAADDGSGEAEYADICAAAAESPLEVRVVRQEHDGYRLAAARNLAFRAVTGGWAVCADCDMALLPDALEAHERLAAAGVVVVGNRALLGEGDSARLMAALPEPSRESWEAAWRAADKGELEAALAAFRKHAFLRRWHLARPHKPKVIGCHFALSMDDVRRVNGFDENFVGWGYEDDDFGRRLYLAGVRPVCGIEAARAMHVWHPSLAPQKLARHRDRPNRAYFYRRGVEAFCGNGIVKG
jgi:GT2 family glycosyltransferase